MAEKKTEPPAEASAAEATPKKSKLKLIVFALLGLLVLAGGGGAAAYFFLGIGKPPPPEIADGDAAADDSKNSAPDARGAQKPSEKPPAKAAEKPAEKPADKQTDKGGKKGETIVGGSAGFVPVPSLVVNLRDGNKLRYLRLSVSLELSDANAEGAVKGKMPKITDVFQMFLRTQTPESFASVGALTTVRSEMLMRVNQIDDGIKIKSVLFQELMIQ
jgi:flagellar protein FliL